MNVSNVLQKEDTVHGTIPAELLGETALALINATDELVVLTGENGDIIALNNKFAGRYETDGGSIVGSSVYDVLTGDLAAKTRDMVFKVFKDGKTAKFEARTSGSWMKWSYPIQTPRKHRQGWHIHADITKERRYEALGKAKKKYCQIVNTAKRGHLRTDEVQDHLRQYSGPEMLGYRRGDSLESP